MLTALSDLIVHSLAPLNAEPPPDRLRASFITPDALFYIRTHGTVPRLDPDHHRIRVDGLVSRRIDLSPANLRTDFPRHRVTATLQCAGNRRAEMSRVRPVQGTPWRHGAIGTAEWSGVALADVLCEAGLTADAGHVAFASVDAVEHAGNRFAYGASIPLAKALASEVLIADEMNGRPLSAEHGYPVRLVVPGYVGARSVKWLGAIRVQNQPSDNYFQREDYKLFPPGIDADTVNYDLGTTLYTPPLSSVICDPANGATLVAGPVIVRGYAVAGDQPLARVEVSSDGGHSWIAATLERPTNEPWAWRFWRVRLEMPPGDHSLAVRAWDSTGQTQPERIRDVWNFKGYVNNAWHQVRVRTAG